VERALAFLELVAVSSSELTVRDVAGRLGVNLTTCYHLYNTHAAHGYVERNPDLTLRVGRQAAVLYDGYRRGFSGQRRMQEFVAELAAETTETAWLSTLTGDSVVLTAYAEGPQPVRATGLYVGLTGLEHVRSSGRAVLAHLHEERRERILQKSLSGVAPAQRAGIREALKRDFAVIRERGWGSRSTCWPDGCWPRHARPAPCSAGWTDATGPASQAGQGSTTTRTGEFCRSANIRMPALTSSSGTTALIEALRSSEPSTSLAATSLMSAAV
jgi:DNA-binding IclR family transcriptional regulator